ncbi:MAG TPA: hypothetical protein VFF74_08185 [Methylophilaceae bacterium]|nr:hypothetical protein [Methylophilaceae bacterium]
MSDIDEFEKLERAWYEARQAETNAQIVVDLKMRNFLNGNGPHPTKRELERLEDLRGKEAEAHNAMEGFISERIAGLRLVKR